MDIKCQQILWMISECFFGFLMSLTAFRILPLSVEISGLLISFLGIFLGSVLCCLIKKCFGEKKQYEFAVGGLVLLLYFGVRFPFLWYPVNGFYLGILSGSVLSLQVTQLSQSNCKKKFAIWYFFGLLLGILLK